MDLLLTGKLRLFQILTLFGELQNRDVARKSIVASRDIQVGEVFTESNLTAKRPGTGISPMEWDEIIGTKAKQSYVKDDLIQS